MSYIDKQGVLDIIEDTSGYIRTLADATYSPLDHTHTSTTTATLTTSGWSNNTKTVNVSGVTASNTVVVSPAPSSVSDYAAAGIYCSAQASGTLTFTCTTVPSAAITVNVLIFT